MVEILQVSFCSHIFDLSLSPDYHSADFMGDMAFVSHYFSIGVVADSNFLRFGGGFELMKVGRDTDGFWTLIESSLRYVSMGIQSVRTNLS